MFFQLVPCLFVLNLYGGSKSGIKNKDIFVMGIKTKVGKIQNKILKPHVRFSHKYHTAM